MGALQKRLSAASMHVLLLTSVACAATLPERIFQAAKERTNAGWYPSLAIAFIDGDKSMVAGFGTLDNGKAPDGRTVYEIGSITKTFTAALLAQGILSGRVKPETPAKELLPGFDVPSRSGKPITLASLATQSSGLPYMPEQFVWRPIPPILTGITTPLG